MIGSRAWRALMRRNAIYRKRNIVGSIAEFALPVLFVAILVIIRNAVEGTSGFAAETVEAFFPGDEDTFLPFSFTDYVTAIGADRRCVAVDETELSGSRNARVDGVSYGITGIADQGYNWQVPFVKCDSRRCKEERDAAEYCEYHALGLAPNDESDARGKEQAEAFRDYINARYPGLESTDAFDFDFVQMFDSDEAVEDYTKAGEYGSSGLPKLAFVIVFDGTDDTINYNYRLRMNSTNFNSPEDENQPAASTTPPTDSGTDTYAKKDEACSSADGMPELGPLESSCTGQYVYNGALTMQRLMGDFIIQETGAKDLGYFVSEHGVRYAQFPTPEFEENGFYAAIAAFAPLLITLGLLYPVSAMIRAITLEKELRQKELMLMMSITESDIGWSWFLSFFFFHLVTATATALVTASLFENSSGFLIWLFWVLSFLSIITFCMCLSAFSSKSPRATLLGLLIFFVGYFLTLVVDIEDGSASTISLISLHPVTAFSYGIQEIGRLEDAAVGLTADTISTTDSPSGYTFSAALASLVIDSILYGVLSWYFNRALKSDYGRSLPWSFPCSPSYWFGGRGSSPATENAKGDLVYDEGVAVEEPSASLKDQIKQGEGIEIRNLRKTFGDKTAVDGLSMQIFSNQITALLGHNGAGKTTTISMLTGMIGATDGYAKVSGKDIRTQMPAIRQETGICLQHDCLFPDLTVAEHIRFFARVKGLYQKMSHDEAEEKVSASIQDVALAEKSNTFSKNLSGGMKRKLSVAIAFCGDSKTVLLDEPTSGMDPFSRRFTWNVIRQYRKGRCIILTTHFMDEADILGDRIAIMAAGRLRCLGSSLFLKKTYGVGYQLTIEKPPSKSTSGTHDHQETDSRLKDIVMNAVPEANLLSNVGTELSFQLPIGAAKGFAPMLQQLDDEADQSRIVTYGVGVTTLDEVFLLVARGDAQEKKDFASSAHLSAHDMGAVGDKSLRSRIDLENEGLMLRHVKALFRKRASSFKRDKKAWLCTTILPTLFVLFGFILFAFVSPDRNLKAIELSLDAYNPDITSDAEQPRNPIPFNAPSGPHACLPGSCIYEAAVVQEKARDANDVDGSYIFCGPSTFLEQNLTCSISESQTITSRVDAFGSEPFALEVATILEGSRALSSSSDLFAATQYGGIFFTHDPTSSVDETGQTFAETVVSECQALVASGEAKYMTSDECEYYGGIGYVIRYNVTGIHAAPTYQSLADEAIVREALGNDEFKIKTTIHPLPMTEAEDDIGKSQDAFTAWFLIVLSFPFITGSFATFVVTERESKAKHLQTVAGVKPFSYWLSTWMWDVANYQIPLWSTIALMFIFDVEVLTTAKRGVVGGIICLLFLFGPAAASFTYCVTFLFKSPSICNLFVIISGFLIGLGGTLAAFILRLLGDDLSNPNPTLLTVARIIEWTLRLIPAFNLSKGIYSAIFIDLLESLQGESITVWHGSILLYEVIFLAWQSVVYLFIAMKIDEWSANPKAVSIWQTVMSVVTLQFLWGSSKHSPDDKGFTDAIPNDEDVLAEQERVLAGNAEDDLIVLKNLAKVYDNGKIAVKNLSFGIPPGQCFGLLGINGAGKTTTMGMLTAEFPPSGGDATLAGYSVLNEPEKTRRRVGYCPQFDAHFANLTGREHIELYASIKGIPASQIREASADKLREVGLHDVDSDRLSAGYSGGMKRRLSLACATIGQPQIVFLDECSTGVDPVARREIWQMVSDMVTGGNVPPEERTSVILTTHSMEECEALCPNIGIMAAGKLRCLGSAQHLKSKFGQGYQVEMKIKNVERSDDDCLQNAAALSEHCGVSEDSFVGLDQTLTALGALTGDDYLSSIVNEHDPTGYTIYKDASSPAGIEIGPLAVFATAELRMRKLNSFITDTYPGSVIRERQDTKARYEVGSGNVRIANIFASIEDNKADLFVAEYGVSQTSLEQVFNMHAAEAEKLKHGTNDA